MVQDEVSDKYQDDKRSNLIGEIYYEGVRAGYDLAKFRLELLDGGMPFGMADDFLSENMGNIREILDLYLKEHSDRKKWLKRVAARRVRSAPPDCLYNHGDYKRLYDLWWTLW